MAAVFDPYVNDPDVESARALVAVALVFYGAFGILFIFVAPAYVPVIIVEFRSTFIIVGLLSFVMLGVVYATVQAPLWRGNVLRPAVPALVMGILSILLLNIISGILLLVAYARMSRVQGAMGIGRRGRVMTGRVSPSAPTGNEGSGVSSKDTRYCASCGAPLVPLIRNCTSCGTAVPPRPGPPTND